jgi:hypothetical protein
LGVLGGAVEDWRYARVEGEGVEGAEFAGWGDGFELPEGWEVAGVEAVAVFFAWGDGEGDLVE